MEIGERPSDPEAGEKVNSASTGTTRWVAEMTLAYATDLARSGHYAEAENALGLLTLSDDLAPEVLDLLARIRAQQGRLGEAEGLWWAIGELTSDPSAYRPELERIARLRRGGEGPHGSSGQGGPT